MIKSPAYFIIPLHIYPFDVMVSIEEKDDVLLKRLLKYGNTKEECEGLLNLPKTTTARCEMLPSNQTVIRFKLQKDKFKMMSIVNHESFHAATFILERVGMKMIVQKSDEAYAYLLGYISECIYRKMF